MKAAVLAGVLGLAGGAVCAQGLPQFDESLGYEVRSAIDGTAFLVRNGNHDFFCETEDGPDFRYIVLDECVPIIGPRAAVGAERGLADAEAAARAFITAVATTPADAFAPAVAQSMREVGCRLGPQSDEDAFMAILGRNVAVAFGYGGPVTDAAIEEIRFRTEETGDRMVETGQIVVDRGSGIATLTECP